MDYQQSQFDYVNSQLKDFSINPVGTPRDLSGSSTPIASGPQLRRSTSLMDAIGIQRTQSPFHSANDSQNIFQQSRIMNWNQSTNSNQGSMFQSPAIPPMQAPQPLNSNLTTPSFHGQPLDMGPPGMIPAQTPLQVPTVPVFVLWHYLDQSNRIQGPFNGDLMDQWYSSGFFTESLQLMPLKCNDPFQFSDRFISLRDLLEKTGDTRPFHQFDLICSKFASQLSFGQLNNIPSRAQSELDLTLTNNFNPQMQPSFSSASRPSFSQFQDQVQNSSLQNLMVQPKVNQTSIPSQPALKEGFESPDLTHAQILQFSGPDGSFYHDTTTSIPASKHIQIVDSFEQFRISKTPQLNGFSSKDSKSSSVLNMSKTQEIIPTASVESIVSEMTANYVAPSFSRDSKNSNGVQNTPNTNIEIGQTKNKATTAAKPGSVNETSSQKQSNGISNQNNEDIINKLLLDEELERKRKEEKLRKKEQKSNRKDETAKVEDKGPTPIPASSTSTIEGSKNELTGWKKNSEPTSTAFTLMDIQKKQAEEKKRREVEREKKEREAALLLQQALLMEEEKKSNPISSVANWISNSGTSQSPSVKTVEQARQEALEAKKLIEEQKRILENIKKNNIAQSKPASSSNAPTATVGWTTVSKKKVVPETTKSINQGNSILSPDRLHAISSGSNSRKKVTQGSTISIPTLKKPNQSSVPAGYTGNESTSARKQFLSWCRSQMKLSPGVKVDFVLEMLLSLPPTMESKEIIADTIYANSAVMEGRSFAAEFIKKRIECEKILNDPLSWSEALSMPLGNEDDWEFQVVSKKKGKKY